MLALLCAGLTLACSLPGCSRATKLERYNKQFLDVFDTVSMEIGFEKSEADFQKCYESSHAQLLKEHRLYDIYNDYEGINNLKTVNDNAGIQPVKVDPDLLSLIKWGKEVYTLTDGKVNIAYGAVLRLWHDKREAGIEDPTHAELPDPAALEEAAKHTNIEDVIIDDAAGTIYLKDPEMSLDVGGIGKGYATENAAKLIQNEGSENFLLNLGGNVRAIGIKGDARSGSARWRVRNTATARPATSMRSPATSMAAPSSPPVIMSATMSWTDSAIITSSIRIPCIRRSIIEVYRS